MQRTTPPLSSRLPRPHAITLALLTMLPAPWLATATWAAAPSQNPLVSKATQQAPNVMLTLDTSWSMIFPYIPEGTFKLPGGSVTFPSYTSVIMHPSDNRYDVGTGQWFGDGGVIAGDPEKTASVFQMQMRSPDVNALYYDPRVRYKPWITYDATQKKFVRYPDALPDKAYFDPNKADPTNKLAYADLTASKTTITAYWCTSPPYLAGQANAGKLDCGRAIGGNKGGPVAKAFSPGLYYRLGSNSAGCSGSAPNPNDGNCYTKFDINTDTSFTRYPNRDDCKGATCTQAEERTNFANWFVYYRTRLHMAQAAVPEAFINLDDDKVRVGWAIIHKTDGVVFNVDGQNSNHVIAGMRNLDQSRKDALTNWIRDFASTKDNKDIVIPETPRLRNGTPLREALSGVGNYFSRTDNGSPWATNPGASATAGASAALACRRAYNVLITDGYYNDADPTVGNVDNVDGPAISGPNGERYSYKASDSTNKLYRDDKANTLADVAMQFWKTDLNPNLDNKVPAGNNVPGQDPAFWQHLVQLPIGLGITGSVPNDSTESITKFVSQYGWWSGDNSSQRVDDLLHAAFNTRGQYFSAKKASELTNALTSALNRAARRDGLKEAGVATASLSLGGTNVKYVPEYTTEQWLGDLKAYSLLADGTWSTIPKWSATLHLPAAADRNIVTVSKGASTQSGVDFIWPSNSLPASATSLDGTSQALLSQNLPTNASGEDLVNYIRGDNSQEDSAQALGLFRQRESKLGDIVNSPPLVLQGQVNLYYDLLPESRGADPGAYKAFLDSKAARDPLIFVGANDGMLHAFSDRTPNTTDKTCPTSGTSSPASCGQEVFAYVPQAVLSKLGKLARRDYGNAANPHQFLVDGPLTESDAYLNGQWRNVLIGTLGAGGQAIYALNVTPGTTLGASSVMWEKSDSDSDDFGYMLGDAQVGVLPDGSWKVFVGNGPYSKNGKAVLMVIDLADGTVTSVGTSADTDNGLGAVRLVKNSFQQVIGVYAGDLKGKLWHFKVDPSTHQVNTGTHIFTASDSAGKAQPITAAPNVMAHPLGGNMITFGTGKLYDDTDNDDTSVQSMYGVWEKTANSTSTPNVLSRTDLVEQVINPTPVETTDGRSYYALTFNNVNYSQQKGWFIDLMQAAGQRVIYPQTSLKNFVLFSTAVPVSTEQSKTCDNEGQGFDWLLPTLMDGAYDKSVILDTNRNGQVGVGDVPSWGFSKKMDGRNSVRTGLGNGNVGNDSEPRQGASTTVSIDTTDPSSQFGKLPGGSWRRVWRQLVTTPHP